MAGPGGWGILGQAAAGGARPVAVADVGYGDSTAFWLELEQQGWRYVVAVKGTTSANPAGIRPVTPPRAAGPPGQAGLPQPVGEPAYAGDRERGPDPAGHLAAGHKGHRRQPHRRNDQPLPGHPVRPANLGIPRAGDDGLLDC